MATPDKLLLSEPFEMSTDNPGTDSYGSKSDHSGKFLHRPRMDVVVVIDLNHHSGLSDRKKAFEEVKITCAAMNNVAVHQIQASLVEISIYFFKFQTTKAVCTCVGLLYKSTVLKLGG